MISQLRMIRLQAFLLLILSHIYPFLLVLKIVFLQLTLSVAAFICDLDRFSSKREN